MLPLAFAAIAAGAVALIAGFTGSSLASVARGHPDHAHARTIAGATVAPGATSSTTEPAGPVGAGPTGVARSAMSYLEKRLRLTPAQAAGIVGNLKQESGLDPAAPGGFLAQWTGSRLAGLESFARRRGSDVRNPGVQLEWLAMELEGPERGTLTALRQQGSARSAARVISERFERPGIPMLANRERYAQEALALR